MWQNATYIIYIPVQFIFVYLGAISAGRCMGSGEASLPDELISEKRLSCYSIDCKCLVLRYCLDCRAGSRKKEEGLVFFSCTKDVDLFFVGSAALAQV